MLCGEEITMKTNMNVYRERLSDNQVTCLNDSVFSINRHLSREIKNFWRREDISFKNFCYYLGYSKRNVRKMIEGTYIYTLSDIVFILYKIHPNEPKIKFNDKEFNIGR